MEVHNALMGLGSCCGCCSCSLTQGLSSVVSLVTPDSLVFAPCGMGCHWVHACEICLLATELEVLW